MRWGLATLRATVISAVALLALACAVVVQAVVHYNGTCGGLLPFQSAAQPCSLWHHVSTDVPFTFAALLNDGWWIGLCFAGAVFMVSVLFQRHRQKSAVSGQQ